VLTALRSSGKISAARYRAAVRSPLQLRPSHRYSTAHGQPFFEFARRELLHRFGRWRASHGGLNVVTTLDPRLQSAARTALMNGLEAYDRRHGWRGPYAKIADMSNDWEQEFARIQQRRPLNAPSSWQLAVVTNVGPQQVTIAGSAQGIDAVVAMLRSAGARRIVPLRISAPFHFPAMGRIADDLREVMHSLRFRDPVVPVISNIDALPRLNAAEIPEALAKHLSSRVEWLRSVRFMVQQNVSTFVELGAGQVVNGLVKRVAEQAALLNVSDPRSLVETLRALSVRIAR
jgi:malonyl CoA-acyl carrier protein transacylase